MDDILNYLEDITQPDSLPPEYFEILKTTEPFVNMIQEKLSLTFLDDLTNAQAEVIRWERQECFARGFRLGARLMLALADPAAPGTRHRSWACQ